jgi:hypothetical protein
MVEEIYFYLNLPKNQGNKAVISVCVISKRSWNHILGDAYGNE